MGEHYEKNTVGALRRAAAVHGGERFDSAAIRAKGNSSMQKSKQTGKYSFKVEFDHFTDELYQGLDKLCLNNLVSDDSCMRDYITYRMMYAFDVPTPLCSYVFVTVNGEDWGFYLAVEGLEDSFLERNFGADHGALYKPDDLSGNNARNAMGRSEDVMLKYIDDDPASYPDIFGSAKTDITRKDQYRLIASLRKLGEQRDIETAVNTSELMRYLIVHSFVCNGDSYTGSSAHNYYLYEDQGRLSLLPWDYNEAFGAFGSGSMASVVNDPIDTPVMNAELADRPMVAWIFSDDAYIERYHALYQAFLQDICCSGWLADTIETTRDMIAPYVERDPRSFCTYDAFTEAVDTHLTFFSLRAESRSAARIDASALPASGGGMFGMMGGGGRQGGPSR